MLNYVHIEGIVVRNWTYDGARFLRLACERDPGREQARAGATRQGTDYMTLRFEPPLAAAVAQVDKGVRLQAHGWLASREYEFLLAGYAERLAGEEAAVQTLRETAAAIGTRVHKRHVLNEVIVERYAVLPAGKA